MSDTDSRSLIDAAATFHVALHDHQAEQLFAYLDLMLKWNKAYNLTAVTNRREMIPRHLLDSLSIAPLLQSGESVLDVGTGAGLPGIPLAIALPEVAFTLLDALSKRTRFLLQVIAQLGLTNVQVHHGRVEQVGLDALNRPSGFSVITSRAFTELGNMTGSCEHLLAEKGRFLAMKGHVEDRELDGVGPQWQTQVQKLEYPGRQGARHAVILSAVSVS